MKRREFLAATTAATLGSGWLHAAAHAADPIALKKCGPGFANPAEAMRADRESLLHVVAIYAGTPIKKPDYLATVDVDPSSPTYSQVIHRQPMPHVGDELHHFGWNACSSCHADSSRQRRYLIVPGFASSRLYVLDLKNPRAPRLHKVIEPGEIVRKSGLSAPHTVHCLANGQVMISMLGDAVGNAPGGFLLLDDQFDLAGRWERSADKIKMRFNYDFWYQPRHNVMVSSEWAAPRTFRSGFQIKDVKAGKYGQRLNFWDWGQHQIRQTVDLGENGLIPLEVRFHHDPDSTHGFVGAALSSAIWHWYQHNDRWLVEKIIQVPPVEAKGWPFPVPSLITDVLLSMDDRFLYFSNWLHGDLRQYDISDPSNPRLAARLRLGGVLDKHAVVFRGRKLTGGPQMLQLSLDGKRLYVTSSLYSTWDNQFYPEIAKRGSYMLQIDCDPRDGGMTLNEDFYLDFGAEPEGPARAHEMRLSGGDSTSDIFV